MHEPVSRPIEWAYDCPDCDFWGTVEGWLTQGIISFDCPECERQVELDDWKD